MVLSFGPWSAQPSYGQSVPIPQLALWESQMITYGQQHCANLAQIKNGPLDTAVGATYYDLTRVMHQIAAYTGDTRWLSCADDAMYAYYERYVLPNNGAIPGYWNFSTGIRMDWQRTRDPRSQQGVVLLSTAPAYTSDLTDLASIASFPRIREVAYALLSYINAEAVGQPRRARRATYVTLLLNHLAQLQDSSTWGEEQVAPFMMALGAEALIRDWEQTKDPRLVPALSAAADFFWYRAWAPKTRSMLYQINPADLANGGSNFNPAPDLNLLIAPVYAWLYAQTGDTTYRDQSDLLFANGVQLAWIIQSKQYNQSYRWSFDYVKWRGGPVTLSTAPPPPATGLTVKFTSPAAGATLGGTATFAIAVTGASASITVAPAIDGKGLAWQTFGGSTATVTVNTTTLSNSSHTLSVKVTDSEGKTGTATLSFVVSNAGAPPPPSGDLTVQFISPAAGAELEGSVPFVIAMTGASGSVTVAPAIDGTALASQTSGGSTASVTVDTRTLTNSGHTLSVRVTDSTGKTATATRSFVVNNWGGSPPPSGNLTVNFISPAAGSTVNETVTFAIAVTGASGSIRVDPTVDGAALGSQTSGGSTATVTVNTTTLSDSGHTLSVTVTDGAGNTGTATTSFVVCNCW
jgi:hypothetical protein